VSQFQKLEAMLRKHGFIVGVLTLDDEKGVDGLLKDIRETFTQSDEARDGD
jgi:hypothetical protein